MNFWWESHSAESVCFNHNREKWLRKKINSTEPGKTYQSKGAGCYRIKCRTAEVGGFKVYVDVNEYECKTDGQEAMGTPLITLT